MIGKYELCFYWEEDKNIEYGKAAINFGKGICISNDFKIIYDDKLKSIEIFPKTNFATRFYNEGISSLTAIVGKNGAGKTTLLNKLRYDISDGQINHYILILYSNINMTFIVLYDDNNMVNNIKIDDSIRDIKIEKIKSNGSTIIKYLSDTTFIYYNNQITSNIYLQRYSSNGIDVSTERMVRDIVMRVQEKMLNSFYIKSNENYDIIMIQKKEERIKALSVLSFLSKNNITDKINITFPKNAKIYFQPLEFQIDRRKSLMRNLSEKEKSIMNNSINLFQEIFTSCGNDFIKHFIFERYNTIIDEYIKIIIDEQYYKQAIKITGKNYTDLNFKSDKIDFALDNIKNYIGQLPINNEYSGWKKQENGVLDVIIDTFCYIKIVTDFSYDIFNSNNQKNVESNFDYRNNWARSCKYYIFNRSGISVPGIKEMVRFTEKYKDRFQEIVDNIKYLEIEIPIKNFNEINDFVDKVWKSVYLFNNILRIEYDIKFSSGEDSFYNMFGRLYDIGKEKLNDNIIILLDEPNNTYHPEWEQKFVNVMTQLFPQIFTEKKIQIVLTTHSPIMLSDIPKENIVFLNNNQEMIDTRKYISYIDENVEIDNTFGANIYNLYKNAFFLRNNSAGIIGDLAYKHIKTVNEKLDNISCSSMYKDDIKYCESIIGIIGESIIKSALEDKLKLAKEHHESQQLKDIIKKYDNLSAVEQKELIAYIIKKSNKEHKFYD